MKLDFHTHSDASDGELSPAALIGQAAEAGVTHLALTDHDTTEGLAAAQSRATELGLQLVYGVELSVREAERGVELHLLGLGIDPAHDGLQATLEEVCALREQRSVRILAHLERRGVGLSSDALGKAPKAAGRPHIARALVAAGHCRTTHQAFERYLAKGKPAHEPSPGIPAARAIAAIKNAGGVTCLAHPMRSAGVDGPGGIEAFVERLVGMGLDGLELYHPSLTRPQRKTLRRLARRWNLVVSAGSDFHGPNRNAALGVPDAQPELLQPLLERLGIKRRGSETIFPGG